MSMTQTLNIPMSTSGSSVKTHTSKVPAQQAQGEVKLSASDVRVFYGQTARRAAASRLSCAASTA